MRTKKRPNYEKLALGFVGVCVAGLYAVAAVNPVKPVTYTLPLDQGGDDQPPPEAVFTTGVPAAGGPQPEVEDALIADTVMTSEGGSGKVSGGVSGEVSGKVSGGVIVSGTWLDEVAPAESLEDAWTSAATPATTSGVASGAASGADGSFITGEAYQASYSPPAQTLEMEMAASPTTVRLAAQLAAFKAPPKPAEKPLHKAQAAKARKKAKAAESFASFATTDVANAVSLRELFASLDYRLDDVRAGHRLVPRLYLTRLPQDLEQVDSVNIRKTLFLRAMLPLVLEANESVEADRRRLLGVRTRINLQKELTATDRKWLKEMVQRYKVEDGDVNSLLRRVDIVPPALALAQAIEESGWGTSRFALEGNSPFGQWTYDEAKGLVPRQRDKGENHAVVAYAYLFEGVRAYVHNLNTHRAYREFRIARENGRLGGGLPGGFDLAETLVRYSERGKDYVATLRRIMSTNDLPPLDGARLHEPSAAKLAMSDG